MIKQQHQDLGAFIDGKFQKLSSVIANERTLSEQIMDLREIKATVREQLQASELALQKARVDLVEVQRKDSEHLGKIAVLENELRARQPVVNDQVFLRLQILETNNKDLRRDLGHKSRELDSLSKQMRKKDEDMQQLEDRLLVVHTQLEESHKEIEGLHSDKFQHQKQATQEKEEIRQSLTKAADQELEALKSKHLDAIQHLKFEQSPFEKKHKEVSLQLVMMRNEKESFEKEAAEVKAALEAKQRAENDEVRPDLRLLLRF